MNDVSLVIKLIVGIVTFLFCITTPFIVRRTIAQHLQCKEYYLAYTLPESSYSCDEWIEDNTDDPKYFTCEPIFPEDITDIDALQIERDLLNQLEG